MNETSGSRSSAADFGVVVPAGFVWTFPARIDRWIDGDSFIAHIRRAPTEEWQGVEVRVDGINAIELSAQYGREALNAMIDRAPDGTQVVLVERKREKYGRELARVILADGEDLGAWLLTQVASDGSTPLAVPYNP